MRENTQEKGLIKINENSFFYKIKNFFRKLFIKNEINNENVFNIESEKEVNKNLFMENIRNIENEETRLLKIQKDYDSGKISEKELTEEQIKDLINLYKKQNEELRKNIAIREKRLLDYRKKLQTNN